AISMGNYWQGIVAEGYGYATMFYLDALFVIAALLLIPFLQNREDGTKDGTKDIEQTLVPVFEGVRTRE
ncbi:MAG: hypothetical protein WBN31_07605, partial [Gammaproteobacteria bacterium]